VTTCGDCAPYYVFRRRDGYVGCIRYQPRLGETEVLFKTDTWADALDRLLAERDEKHYALVRSWDEHGGSPGGAS